MAIRLVPMIHDPVYPDPWPPEDSTRRPRWTPAEKQVVRERYLTEGVAGCEKLLPARAPKSIYQMAKLLGLRKEVHRPKRYSTPEIDADLRAAYAAPDTKATMKKIVKRYAVTRDWCYRRAVQLGLRVAMENHAPWSPAEIAILESSVEFGTQHVVRNLRRRGHRRSIHGVRLKAKQLGLPIGGSPDVFSLTDIECYLGAYERRVRSWIDRGLLKATREPPQPGVVWINTHWRIKRADLREFLITYPLEWSHNRADHLWLVELLAGRIGPRNAAQAA